MAAKEAITIPIDFPSPDEAMALAQLLKRIDHGMVIRLASRSVWYSGRAEVDVMWSAVCDLQRQLAEAGFNPR
jgi:hypothetical protein